MANCSTWVKGSDHEAFAYQSMRTLGVINPVLILTASRSEVQKKADMLVVLPLPIAPRKQSRLFATLDLIYEISLTGE